MRVPVLRAVAVLAAALIGPGPAHAQTGAAGTPGFLIINQEQLLTGSKRGQALLAEETAARERLRGEARATDAAFEAEEQSLTELRATLDAAGFRAKADDFDARVVAARRDQDGRSAALVQEFDAKRRQFYASVAPILVRIMERYGALAIFDETSVLLADQSLIITDAVIGEIDAPPAPAAAAPAVASPTPGPSVQAAPMPRPSASTAPEGGARSDRE